MTEDLDTRLQRLQASDDVYALIDLGCDLADVGRQTDAEWCFRRAAELGDTVGSFNLGNAPAAQKRWAAAVDAYEVALAGGEVDPWRNLGKVLEDLGDLAGAMRAYRGAVDAGDLEGGLQFAFLLREQGERAPGHGRRDGDRGPGGPGGRRRRRVLALVRHLRPLARGRPPGRRGALPGGPGRPRPPAARDGAGGEGPIRAREGRQARGGRGVASAGQLLRRRDAGRRGSRGGLPLRHRRGRDLLPPQPRRAAGRARRLRRCRGAVPARCRRRRPARRRRAAGARARLTGPNRRASMT